MHKYHHSPDNDIYNIGFGLIDAFTTKNVWIQTKKHPYESEYVNIQQIVEKASSNLHLNEMSLNKIGNLLQILFIVTGCDYVSYFKNHPKTPIL